MKDAIEFYCANALQDNNIQKSALEQFKTLGFPNKSLESWRYTNLKGFLAHEFKYSKKNIEFNTVEDIVVLDLAKALDLYKEKLFLLLDKILPIEHGLQALNLAMLQEGLFIYVPKNVNSLEPLKIKYNITQDNSACYIRNIVYIEAGSKLSILEEFIDSDNNTKHTNVITEALVEAGAQLSYYKFVHNNQNHYHYAHMAIAQKKDSIVNTHMLTSSSCFLRSDLSISLQEPGASCYLNGMNIVQGKDYVDSHTKIMHIAPNCNSEQDYKSVVQDKAHLVFDGSIEVQAQAIGTNAVQSHKSLLLSSKAIINTKPQLQIFADDVKCKHGATIGQLDEDVLFYFTSRGISALDAKIYLVRAFFAKNMDLVDKDFIKPWLLLWEKQVESSLCNLM